ncbi:ubiquitin fusion degradation protein [Microbotryomycetes sp. JL201]|nr:ubiquitin fusion degradation protein [Microbotryomycetes sp. JL201]
MSSDDDYQDIPSDYEDDDGFVMQDVDDEQLRSASNRRHQAAPAAMHHDDQDDDQDEEDAFGGFRNVDRGAMGFAGAVGGMFGGLGAAAAAGRRGPHPGAFQAGFGGHAFAHAPAGAFRKSLRAYSAAILEVQEGRSYGLGRKNFLYGGKIVMPASALEELAQLDIELPIDYEISNPAVPDLKTHVGVLEFIAQEGTVNLPQWVMDQLRLNEGDPIRLQGARFPKGKMIKIQPQSVDFLEISDPKAVLEQALRHYSVLSAGDIIEISYESLTFRILIMEITPPGPAISVIDTDIEVDFAAPLGYVEPERKPVAAAPTMKDRYVIDTNSKQDVDARGSGTSTPVPGGSKEGGGPVWEAFKGSGQSLSGKRIKGKGLKIKKIEQVEEGSRIMRTDKPRIITADTQIGNRQVPAALNVPFGNLFFGYEVKPPPGSAEEQTARAAKNAEEEAAKKPFAAVGQGSTLSGRTRSLASTPSGAPSPAPEIASSRTTGQTQPAVPFSGSGHSLTGSSSGGSTTKKPSRKNVDVIEID